MSKNTVQLQINTDRGLIPHGTSAQRVLEICLRAPATQDQNERPQLNLALVLDRSGSMSGDKLTYVKAAAKHVIKLLQEQDNVALVTFDNQINVVSPSVRASSVNRRVLLQRLEPIEPGGNTNLSGGWLAGCQEAASAAAETSINRTLLLTDGEANAGIINPHELAQHASELSKRGVSTSTFGVGDGFNEHLLEAMANQGGGNFYFIDQPAAIPDIFLREFKELAAVTARDVEISIDFPADLLLQVPGGWRHKFSPGNLRIFLGNLFSDQTQEVYIRLSIPVTSSGADLVLKTSVSWKGEDGAQFNELSGAVFKVAGQTEVDAAPQNREMQSRFALVYVAEIANEALKLERRGENIKASSWLTECVLENQSYLSKEETDRYLQMAERMKHGMDERDRKQSHFNAYNQKRRKEP